eukprot:6982049-Alexandrium_andersonii.AAC.1
MLVAFAGARLRLGRAQCTSVLRVSRASVWARPPPAVARGGPLPAPAPRLLQHEPPSSFARRSAPLCLSCRPR